MRRQHLRVPQQDQSLLAVPSLEEWPELALRNHDQSKDVTVQIAGLPLQELRSQTQSETVRLANSYGKKTGVKRPETSGRCLFVITGHQPELYHPGVWVKSFATYQLAHSLDAFPLHILIDNDTLKSTSIRMPAGNLSRPYLASVAFDQLQEEIPFEECEVTEERLFRDFAAVVQDEMAAYPYRPIAKTFWPLIVDRLAETRNIGRLFASARQQLERKMGIHNAEVPLSKLCTTSGFVHLVAELCLRAEEFAKTYNHAVLQYRTLNGLRSKNHPVPELETLDGWTELPLWTWTTRDPARRRVFVQTQEDYLVLRTEGQEIARLPFGDRDDFIASLERAELGEWKLRPRALITTMFIRLFLADLFIHGVGGGKYDEVTDEIIRDFFSIEPPAFAVLSATVRLPVNTPKADPNRLEQLRWQRRDMQWNPDRYIEEPLRDLDPAAQWIERKHELMNGRGTTRRERIQRFREFRHLNDELRRLLGRLPQEIEEEEQKLAQAQATADRLSSREFSFIVHDQEKLAQFLSQAFQFKSPALSSEC